MLIFVSDSASFRLVPLYFGQDGTSVPISRRRFDDIPSGTWLCVERFNGTTSGAGVVTFILCDSKPNVGTNDLRARCTCTFLRRRCLATPFVGGSVLPRWFLTRLQPQWFSTKLELLTMVCHDGYIYSTRQRLPVVYVNSARAVMTQGQRVRSLDGNFSTRSRTLFARPYH